jgi:hypothetical protein
MAEVDLMSALIGLDMRLSCHISDRMVEAYFFLSWFGRFCMMQRVVMYRTEASQLWNLGQVLACQ